jgi:hypothetical protein
MMYELWYMDECIDKIDVSSKAYAKRRFFDMIEVRKKVV